MADAKIVDIKGVQWELKDEVARNKVAELETKTTINEKILIQKGASFISLVTINGKKFLDFHFYGDIKFSLIGQKLFNIGTEPELTVVNRVLVNADKINGSGRFAVNLDISPNGDVFAFPLLENIFGGEIEQCALLGDNFIKTK